MTGAEPIVVVAAASVLPTGAPTGEIMVGASESAALPVLRGVAVEAGAAIGATLALEFAADVWAGARLELGRSPLSLLAAGGGQVRDGLAPEVIVALGVDPPGNRRVAPHADLGWVGAFEPGGVSSAVLLTLGVSFTRPPPPAPPPAPAPPPSPSSVSLTLDPVAPGAQVWLPHPVCDWVPVDQVNARLAGREPPIPATVYAPGYEPATVSLTPTSAVSLVPAPPQGSLVIVAYAGDRVTVGGAPIALGADGTAVVTVPQGPVAVSIVGGGRSMSTRVQAESGFAAWLRAPAPEPWTVRFPVGSSTPLPTSRRELAARIPDLGDSLLGVRGSYSPEGAVESNQRLADARAAATRDLLVTLGAPADHVVVLPSLPPAEGVEPGDQRIAEVFTLWPGGGP